MSKMIIVEGNSNDKDNVRVLMVKGEKGDTGDVNIEQLNAEATARTNADNTLQFNINTEATLRTNADNILQSNIDNEEEARTNADSNLQSQISSLSNGSPLVASSTSEMTDTSKVYVNTTDGKWYYYNGSNWTVGGTYQSSGIADGSINVVMLDKKLQENFNIQFGNIYVPETTQAGYYKENPTTHKSEFVSNTDYASYSVNLEIGKVYCFSGFNYGAVTGLLIVDASDNVLYSSNSDTSNYNLNGCSHIFNVQVNGYRALISPTILGAPLTNMILFREVVNISNNLKFNNSMSLLKTFNNYNLTNTNVVDEIVKFRSADDYTCDVYEISKGTTYRLTGKNYGNVRSLVITDLNNNVLYLDDNSTSSAYVHEYTATEDGFAYLVNYVNETLVNSSIEIVLKSIEIETPSILKGKKIVYDGDSICESRLTGNAENGGAYAKLIADNTECTYVNQAVGGGTISYQENQTAHSVVNNLTNLPTDGDIYCFEGGINDWWSNVNLGTFDKYDYTSELDISTYSGALEYIFRYAINNFVGKQIVFVIIHKVANPFVERVNGTFEQFRNRMIEICEKYAIPYYDAWKYSGLNGMIEVQKNNYLNSNATQTPDGTHPNKLGYEKYYVPQLTKLFESLI